jgi:polyferredoxin
MKLVDEHPGSERLLALAKTYGVTPSRFKSSDYEDFCILYGLCVRACDEVAGPMFILRQPGREQKSNQFLS